MPSHLFAGPRGRQFSLVLLALMAASPLVAAEAPATPAKAARPPAATSPGNAPTGRVDLNLASEADLEALPKIGPATAKRIVDYRKQVGTIKTVDELVNVQGIGEKTLEILRPHVTVGTSVPAPSAPKKS